MNTKRKKRRVETVKKTVKGKVYTSVLLRCSFRKDGKVKHETLGNLTQLPPDVIEFFPGRVPATVGAADPPTFTQIVARARQRCGINRIVFVGDRGMITSARINEDLRGVEGLDWISALRSEGIRQLREAGAIQMSLFDKQDLAEVTSEHFPQERLVVCRNPALAEQRARKRNEMQFSFLDEKDRAFVVGACKFFFQPAEEPPSKLPDGEMMLRFQLLFTVTFRKNGVAGQTGQGDFDLDWAEVKQVRLLYFDHWSDELCKIELELPIRTLRIEGVNKIKASGFDAPRVANPKVIPAVVADFLRRHVPEEKLVRHALHGPPATLAECEHRRRKLRRELRNVTWCYRLMPAGCLMLISLCLVPQLFARLGGPQLFPNAAWLALATLLLVATILSQPLMIWALLRDLRNRHAKALRELDAWELESLLRTPAESASSFRK